MFPQGTFSLLVSFVIPVLNGERDIARCLLSIRNLKCPQEIYEVIVIDNGSTDGTRHIVRDLGFPCHVREKVNVSALRNQGARLARGVYLAFVDSDVELTPDWLQSGLLAFQDKHVVANGCFPRVPKDATWVQQAWDLHQRGCQNKHSLRPISWLPSMNLLVSREVFITIGGFNERLETAEDVDLCYRLGQRGTILCNPAMDAIHWGEARDLRTFWHKEVWRGTGNLTGALAHGFRWDELPSLGYPLYVLSLVLLLGLSCIFDLWYWQIRLTPLNLGLFVLPASFLAFGTAYKVGRVSMYPKLFVLYLVYGFARAYSVVKQCTL